MTFSVIIPTYNREKIIADTIDSVLAQDFQDFEVIVVDDGSTDDTGNVVKNISDQRVRYFHKINEERSVARNFGAKQAKGKFLIFLDSDDRMKNDHLSLVNQYLTDRSFEPRFLFTGFVVRDSEGKTVYEYKKKGLFSPEELLYGNHLGCSAVVIEKTLFQKYHFNTNPDLVLFEDWELWLRIISAEKLHCLSSGTIIMMNHEGRSVLSTSPAQLQKKALCLKATAMNDVPFIKGSTFAARKLTMGLYSYVALHVALGGKNRLLVLKFLTKALIQDPTLVSKRRFYAIIKHLF